MAFPDLISNPFEGAKKWFGDVTGTGESSSRRQNELNREWQERMANTAVQRRRKDLEAAGFNPLLAVSGGEGAATPSGGSGGASNSGGVVGLLALIRALAKLV